eukprot:scaffold206093_cov35-Attheya_sp.AAC.1
MSRRNRIGYCHKSGTGHNCNKRRSSVISSIPGRRSFDRHSLVDTPLPPPLAPNTAAVMAVTNQDQQPVVHISESSRSTVQNMNSVHSASSSMTDTNSNDDGVLSTSSARLPASSNSPPHTELNTASCSTSLSRSTGQNMNSLHSASSSWMDTNSHGDGVSSTSSARLPAFSNSPPNTEELNAAASCPTSLSLIKNESIGGVSSASTTSLLDPSNKSELNKFRSFILTSTTGAPMSNASPTTNQSTVSSLQSHQVLQEDQVVSSSRAEENQQMILLKPMNTVITIHTRLPGGIQRVFNSQYYHVVTLMRIAAAGGVASYVDSVRGSLVTEFTASRIAAVTYVTSPVGLLVQARPPEHSVAASYIVCNCLLAKKPGTLLSMLLVHRLLLCTDEKMTICNFSS